MTATRALVGKDMLLVTPGIRPAGAALGDQKRVATPAEAFSRGADYIVVGRPILAADDPREAAQAIQREIAEACADKTGRYAIKNAGRTSGPAHRPENWGTAPWTI